MPPKAMIMGPKPSPEDLQARMVKSTPYAKARRLLRWLESIKVEVVGDLMRYASRTGMSRTAASAVVAVMVGGAEESLMSPAELEHPDRLKELADFQESAALRDAEEEKRSSQAAAEAAPQSSRRRDSSRTSVLLGMPLAHSTPALMFSAPEHQESVVAALKKAAEMAGDVVLAPDGPAWIATASKKARLWDWAKTCPPFDLLVVRNVENLVPSEREWADSKAWTESAGLVVRRLGQYCRPGSSSVVLVLSAPSRRTMEDIVRPLDTYACYTATLDDDRSDMLTVRDRDEGFCARIPVL